MRLTVEQQKVLNKLAIQNKIGWFAVIDGYTYDLEVNRNISRCRRSIKTTVRELWEGIESGGFMDLDRAEKEILRNLLISLEIIEPTVDEYNMANPVILSL